MHHIDMTEHSPQTDHCVHLWPKLASRYDRNLISSRSSKYRTFYVHATCISLENWPIFNIVNVKEIILG